MYINCSIISERGVINMAHTYSYRADSKDHDEVKRILDNLGLAKDMGFIEDDTPAFKDTNKLISYMKKRAKELE